MTRPFELIAGSLTRWPDPSVAVAASRWGAAGLLDLEGVRAADAREAIARLVRHGRGTLGVRFGAAEPATLAIASDLPQSIRLVVLAAAAPAAWASLRDAAAATGRRVLAECVSIEHARQAEALSVDGLVAVGSESGGYVGEETTFVLVQRLLAATSLPVFARGGIGVHTAAACVAAGCAGVVLDAALALTRESQLPAAVRAVLERVGGDETVCLGAELGHLYRVYRRPGLRSVDNLQRAEQQFAALPRDEARRGWRARVEAALDWNTSADPVWPLGQDAALAAGLGAEYGTVAAVLDALAAAIPAHVAAAKRLRPLDRHAPLAASQGTEFPILQGPMTRVSDTATFAHSVASAGALPFLALALMRAAAVRRLLEETRQRLGSRPWGVGILGFVPPELRGEQLDVIEDARPSFALIAGGRPDQAARLERQGIPTYLHVPAPGLLRAFLDDGARRFVFEGRECGGHVGPRTSFVLWNTMMDVLLAAVDCGVPAADLHVVFAGGIHDARSSAMVAALAAPLAERGVKIGVLIGTGYLFTHEAVAAGAIVDRFQREALDCNGTVLLETGPGHAIRCANTAFFETFRATKRRLIADGRSPDDVRAELERINLGRLRIASKGIVREDEDDGTPQYVAIDGERQRAEGMYMIGQVAALRRDIRSLRELHEDASVGGTATLERMAAPVAARVTPPPRTVTSRPCDVAVIGMGCLLPGARDVRAFWSNLLNKVDAITEVPKERFDVDQYFDPDVQAPDRIVSRWGGFIGDVPFDPIRYGIPPSALASIDSLQLLALEVARQAIEDSGYDLRSFPRDRTSVILGASGGLGDLGLQYGVRATLPMLLGEAAASALEAFPEWTEDSFAGILLNVAAGRIANRLDLGGVNYTVDAACASALAAVQLATMELDRGTSDMVIVGGIDTVQSPFGYLCFSKSQALSPRGRCRTFDESADGIVISEGLVALVLKRVEDAERDGDRIYAVVKAVAGSSDGRGKGLTAPRPEGQMRALERAYQQAGVPPASIRLIEAHGTGTVAGDAAEVAALTAVLQRSGAAPRSCAIGSVKSMIGHTKSAAGIAGLMKTALALYHRTLPPTLHVRKPNPKLSDPASPLFVNTDPQPWIAAADGTPRRAAVSSFGFGGTNFHAVLEEYAGAAADAPADMVDDWPSELFVWTAGTADALLEGLDEFAARADARPDLALRALAAPTTRRGASVPAQRASVRLAIVAADRGDLAAKLGTARQALRGGIARLADPKGVFLGTVRSAPPVAFLFPGQGSQAPQMLRTLAVQFPFIRRSLERADCVLASKLPRALSSYVYPPPAFDEATRASQMAALTDTVIAQPALGAVEIGLHRLLAAFGVTPQFVGGHSYGEYVALCAAGVFDEDALAAISEARGRAIRDATANVPGTMVAVTADGEAVGRVLDRDPPLSDVWLANFNAPQQTVVAGEAGAIKRAVARLAASSLRATPVPVACAFHTPLMRGAQAALATALQTLRLEPPRVPVFSNALGGRYPEDPAAIAGILAEHLVRPVRFVDEIEAMYAAGARVFVEVGPRAVLTGLARRILDGQDVTTVAIDAAERDGLVQWLHALGQLAAAGVAFDGTALFRGRRVADYDAPVPAPPAWVVNGAGARRAFEAPRPRPPRVAIGAAAGAVSAAAPARVECARSAAADAEPVPAVTAPPAELIPAAPVLVAAAADLPAPQVLDPLMTTPNPLSLSGGSDQVMLEFQRLMSQFLQTQASIMTAYLGAAPVGVGASAVPQTAAPELAPVAAMAGTFQPALPPVGGVVPQPPSPAEPVSAIATGPAPAAGALQSAPAAEGRRDFAALLVSIASERTGYAPDMLGLDLAIEADLGIDSIKRVEILSAVQRQCTPDEQARLQAAMDRLATLPTLGAIAEVMAEAAAGASPRPSASAAPPVAAAAPAVPASLAPRSDSTIDHAAELLKIASERTGYPADMLDLDLNIEADLGVDSIKRVEILSAFQRRLATDQQARLQSAMDRLTSLRTLREIMHAIGETLAAPMPPAPAVAGDRSHPAAGERPAADSTEDVAAVPRLAFTMIEAPPAADARPFPPRACLITDDTRGVADALAARLSHQGDTAIVLRRTPRPLDRAAREIGAEWNDAADLESAIAQVRSAFGRIGAVVHVAPLGSAQGQHALSSAEWRALIGVDVRALHQILRFTAADLTAVGSAGGATVLAATAMGGAYLTGPAPEYLPTHEAAVALMRTVAAEFGDVRCRVVDLQPDGNTDLQARRLAAEYAAADPVREVGYVDGRRLVQAVRIAPLDGGTGLAVDASWVFLLTGGARGITAELACELARRYRPTLVLAGRSPLPAAVELGPTAGVVDPAALRAVLTSELRAQGRSPRPVDVDQACQRVLRDREIRHTLAACRAAGARVEYRQVDVRDETAFAATIAALYRDHGRIDAVVHGAGIIEDRLIKDKTPESFDRVVGTKVDGALTLVNHLRPDTLRLLLFMSSVTAAFGNRGQADYGAANGVLNGMAAALAARWPARVVAMNWGPWDGSGMASEDVRQQFLARGIEPLDRRAGVEALVREIASGSRCDSVVVIGAGPWCQTAVAGGLEVTA